MCLTDRKSGNECQEAQRSKERLGNAEVLANSPIMAALPSFLK